MPIDRLTSIARGIPDSEIGAAVARQRLASVKTDRPVAPAADCIVTARAAGVPMSEMQRILGAARQTVYNAAKPATDAVRFPPERQLREEVLVLVAAKAAYGHPGALADAANLDVTRVMSTMIDLADGGHLAVFRDSGTSLLAEATDVTYRALRFDFDRLLRRRPDRTTVYLQLPDDERAKRILDVALRENSALDVGLIPQSTAPSRMRGNELAFSTPAATIREAIEVTKGYWMDILIDADVDAPLIVADIIPPGGRPIAPSEVLDTLVEQLIRNSSPMANRLREIRSTFVGDADERALALRCAAEAAHAVSRAAGIARGLPTLRTGDDAFVEFEKVVSIVNDVMLNRPSDLDALVPIRDAAKEALIIATDFIGPLPGGRLGGSAGGGEVRPTPEQLAGIAAAAADAIAKSAQAGTLDVTEVMQRVVTGEK